MKPKLMRSGLTGTVYIATKYEERPGGGWRAIEKHTVADEELADLGLLKQPLPLPQPGVTP